MLRHAPVLPVPRKQRRKCALSGRFVRGSTRLARIPSSRLLVHNLDRQRREVATTESESALADALTFGGDAVLLQVQGQGCHRVQHLVVHELHEVFELDVLRILAVHGGHDPTRLDTGHESLALWVARVAGLLLHLTDHSTVAAWSRCVAEDSERLLLELDLVGGTGGSVWVHQGRVGILRAIAQEIVNSHSPCNLGASPQLGGGAHEGTAKPTRYEGQAEGSHDGTSDGARADHVCSGFVA
mmetsp:Transcript_85065/g.203882  ORF Transcript_85065/g.203882 Transcript_85065/m.203882 type:complete len:242 (+) Transcript_85065:84-809(+)